jgi:hypothetical protein
LSTGQSIRADHRLRQLDVGNIDLMLDMLNLINPHMCNARLPKAERCGGLSRNVDDSTSDKRASANDRNDHATAVIEVEDPHPRSNRQPAVRRDQSRVTRIFEI